MVSRNGFCPEILFIGEGPDADLRRRCAEMSGLGCHTRFAGSVEDVGSIYSARDIFVLPNTGREGLSLAALEAMAAGLPVIASRTGGLIEDVKDQRTGLFVPP